MKTSESTKEIGTALGAYQRKVPYIGKDAKNHRNKYVSLAMLNEKSYPSMGEFGLSMTQFPDETKDGRPAITSRLMHESGEWMQATFELGLDRLKGNNPMQDTGIAISYIVRYAKHAILGTAGADDDALSLDQNETGPDFGPLPKPPTNKDIFTADPATLSRLQLKKRVKPLWGKMYEVEEQERFQKMYEDADTAGLAGLITAIENRLNKEGG